MRLLFPSQQENEEIELVVRQHWVYFAQKLLIWVVFVVALLLFKTYAPVQFPNLFDGQTASITNLFLEVYGLILLVTLFLIFVIYYLNTQIITNIRIVDIDQEGLFFHQISELHLDKIEDVTSKTTGVLGTLFDYGQVFVQTAGTVERFEFQNVPHPAQIEKIILDLYEKRPHSGTPNP